MLSDLGVPFLFWLQRKLVDFDLYLSRWIETLTAEQP